MYLILSLMGYSLAGTSDMGVSGTQNIYMYKPPLNFTLSEYATYTGVITSVQLLGLLVLSAAFKLLKIPDSVVICISIVASVVRYFVLAFRLEKLVRNEMVLNFLIGRLHIQGL